MFGLNFVTIFALFAWLVAFLILCKVGRSGYLAGLKWRSVTWLGSTLIITAFFLQPWVQFSFLDYIFSAPQLLKDVFSDEVIGWLAKNVGFAWLEKTIGLFSSVTNVTGLGFQLVPTLGGWSRFWLTAPLALALTTGIWTFIGACLRGTSPARFAAAVVMVCSVILLLGLAFSLPELDALGIQDRFDLLLLSALLGVQLGNGPALTLLGLLLILTGGAIEWQDQPDGLLSRQVASPETLL